MSNPTATTPAAPAGYSPEEVAAVTSLAGQFLAATKDARCHVALSALLSAYIQTARNHGHVHEACETLMSFAGGVMLSRMLAEAQADNVARTSVPCSTAVH